jgi:hypothetical protein
LFQLCLKIVRQQIQPANYAFNKIGFLRERQQGFGFADTAMGFDSNCAINLRFGKVWSQDIRNIVTLQDRHIIRHPTKAVRYVLPEMMMRVNSRCHFNFS